MLRARTRFFSKGRKVAPRRDVCVSECVFCTLVCVCVCKHAALLEGEREVVQVCARACVRAL